MTRRTNDFPGTRCAPSLAKALALTALLLPRAAVPESSLQSGARTASVGATAHVDFRIVIPPVLALSVATGPGAAAPRVTVASNTRQLLVTASAAELAEESRAETAAAKESAPTPASAGTRPAIFVRTGRGTVIAAETSCQLAAARVVSLPRGQAARAIVDRRPVVCTVAMP